MTSPKREPLWPNLQRHKRQMGECGIYMRITKVTMKHLRRHINPHMFRDAAAPSFLR